MRLVPTPANQCVCVCMHVRACVLSYAQLFVTPGTVACQAPLSRGSSRQEYWSRLPFPSAEDLPYRGTEPASPALVGRFFTTSATWKTPANKSRTSQFMWHEVKNFEGYLFPQRWNTISPSQKTELVPFNKA